MKNVLILSLSISLLINKSLFYVIINFLLNFVWKLKNILKYLKIISKIGEFFLKNYRIIDSLYLFLIYSYFSLIKLLLFLSFYAAATTEFHCWSIKVYRLLSFTFYHILYENFVVWSTWPVWSKMLKVVVELRRMERNTFSLYVCSSWIWRRI